MRPLRILDFGLRIESRGRCASTPSAIRNPQSAIASIRPAFSLAELMIAIAILGIGLLMVASMFPIAWTKARDLARHTAAVSCADTAAQTVRLATRVDSAKPGQNSTSFAGDYLVETSSDPSYFGYDYPGSMLPHDTFVHYLTTENVLVTKPADRPSPVIAEYGWPLLMAALKDLNNYNYNLNSPTKIEWNFSNPGVVQQWFGPRADGTYSPAVGVPQRVFPALEAFPAPASATPTADEQKEIDAWTERMQGRRFCWAVFHRLTKLLNTDVPAQATDPNFFAKRQEAASRPRVFDMYYVTLNVARGQRFARQDEAKLFNGEIKAKLSPNPPSSSTTDSLGVIEGDVQFPSPWLVSLLTPEADGSDKAHRFLNFRSPTEMQLPPVNLPATETGDTVPRGVPTEVLIEVDPAKSFDFRDFFEPGTQCIDALNGQVYRVVKRRLIESGFSDDRFQTIADSSKPLKAVLTLDREIFVEDLRNDPAKPYNLGAEGHNPASAARQLWIFPPAIERTGTGDNDWAIVGPTPVAALEVRPLVMTPQ
jgi:prepilin-type N-terminal cleavage/methylation domain-containing protein